MNTVSGVSFNQLAEEFGTPAYVYDGDTLLDDFTRLRRALDASLEIFFSLKANPNISVFGLLHTAGARAEVSSLTELRTALLAGADPENVIFLGPGKSREEIAACIDAGIHAIVAESLDELGLIEAIAGERDRRQRVLLRINPARPASGVRLAMGGKPRQFGVDEDVVLGDRSRFLGFRHLWVAGIHVYLGTRILDAEAVVENTRYILDLAKRFSDVAGIPLETVDIGGGLGVPYFDNESELDIGRLGCELNPLLEGFRADHPQARLILEAGRYLTARCGTYLVGVRSVKRSQGENFAVTDGGTHQHMAAVGIGSVPRRNFPVSLLGRVSEEPAERWNLSGPLCTPGDILAKNALLPPLRTGDLLGVLMSGAYGPTASPVLFLGHGYPAEVLVHRGEAHLVRTRDTVDDLLAKQILCRFA
ncbi:type III PLP-dependent enzyme [Streptomyces sp. NBC_01092]|uniref:type III PLP-dependent enzyme n=1 Tax=Streptomyces sp. NBC_01092 TaxID=2903748 RepID=UPI00386A0AA4|nr:type III PLP-dependent enzyme [Streptomyces sp. NBC_01092]